MIIVKIARVQWMQTMLGGGGREEQPSPPETFAKINFDQILIKIHFIYYGRSILDHLKHLQH